LLINILEATSDASLWLRSCTLSSIGLESRFASLISRLLAEAGCHCAEIEDSLPKEATALGRSSRESSTAKLAKFFPNSTPLRIAVSLTRMEGKGGLLSESTVIEFGTSREVLFASTLPLEFADKLRLRNSDGTLDVEACVVALQYNGSKTAVAARFTQEVANWIVKP
jgi:hypothetical protein